MSLCKHTLRCAQTCAESQSEGCGSGSKWGASHCDSNVSFARVVIKEMRRVRAE